MSILLESVKDALRWFQCTRLLLGGRTCTVAASYCRDAAERKLQLLYDVR
jgi:hypothetical protein